VWALSDGGVADSVQRSDRRVLRAVRQAFIDYGYTADDVDLRSAAMVAAGVGILHVSNPAEDAPRDLRERFVDFLLRP
jgi:hypothetical protein